MLVCVCGVFMNINIEIMLGSGLFGLTANLQVANMNTMLGDQVRNKRLKQLHKPARDLKLISDIRVVAEQTVWMRRLVCAFAIHIWNKICCVFLCLEKIPPILFFVRNRKQSPKTCSKYMRIYGVPFHFLFPIYGYPEFILGCP